MQYGALVHGRRDAASTVEARTVEGRQLVLLLAIHGDLATPALESVKSAFARIERADAITAAKLVAAAPPAPYCAGIAVVLLDGARALVASPGCYLQRGGTLAPAPPGEHALGPGDVVLATSGASLPVDRAFLGELPEPVDDAFANDGLDDALEAALAKGPAVAIAAARTR